MIRTISVGQCLSLVDDLIQKGKGAKALLCRGTMKEAETWRLRMYRAMKQMPDTLRDSFCVEREKIDENLYELYLCYIEEDDLPKFKIIDKDGTISYSSTANERRIEKYKEEEEEEENSNDLTWK